LTADVGATHSDDVDVTLGCFNIEQFGNDEGASQHCLCGALDFLLAPTSVSLNFLGAPRGDHSLAGR